MTVSQVRWASQHDWFLSSKATSTGFKVTVEDFVYRVTTGQYESAKTIFTDINELKAWAGY